MILNFCRRVQSVGDASVASLRIVPIALAFLATSSLSITDAVAQASCPQANNVGEIIISEDESPYGPIACPDVSDLNVILTDGASIESASGTGMFLAGQGDISIATRPQSGNAKIVSSFDDSATGLAAALSIVGDNSGTAGSLDIAVDDIWAVGDGTDALRINNFLGEVTVESTGSIRVDGTSPAFGVWIENINRNNAPYSTTLNIHDVVSMASETSTSGNDVAAVYVRISAAIDVTSTGRILTLGDYSHGVQVIQDVKATTSGGISIEVNDVTTEGRESHAVIAERLQFDSSVTEIDIAVNGRVETFGWGSFGLASAGQGANVGITVSETGSVEVHEPNSDWRSYYSARPPRFAVVVEKPGANPVNSAELLNLGRIGGDVRMVSCEAPLFTNRGEFNPSSSVELIKATCSPLGAGRERGLLENHGQLSLGVANEPSMISLTGDLTQDPTGTLLFDVDWSNERADFLEITGSASLDGFLSTNPISLPNGTQELSILSATAGITGTDQLDVVDTLLIDHELRLASVSGVDTLYLSATFNADFDDDGTNEHLHLNENQRNVLAEIVNSTPTNDEIGAELSRMARLTEIEDLRLDLDRFGNEIAGAAIQTTFHAASGRHSAFQRCNPQDPIGKIKRCGWGDGSFHRSSRKRSWSQRGFSDEGHELAGGILTRFDNSQLLAGFGFNHRRSRLVMENISVADGDNTVAEAILEGGYGQLIFDLTASVSTGRYDIMRYLPGDSNGPAARAELSSKSLGIRGDVKLSYPMGQISVEPSAGVGHSNITSRGYSEEGAGDLSLDVHRTSTAITTAKLALKFNLMPVPVLGMILKPSLSAGYNQILGGTIRVNSDFRGGKGTYLSTTTLPSSTVEIGLGGRLQSRKGRLLGTIGLQSVISEGETLRRSVGGSLNYMF